MSIVLNGTTGITAPDIDVTAQTTVAAFDAGITLGGSATTLDDYEEGTWTPTNAGDATGTITAYGRYTKIGRQVIVHATIQVNSNFTASSLGGLPFAPDHVATLSGVHAIVPTYSSNRSLWVRCATSTTSLIFLSNLVGSSVALNTTDGTLRFTMTYQTA